MSIKVYQYQQKYRPGTYIGIGWTHIGLSLQLLLNQLHNNNTKFHGVGLWLGGGVQGAIKLV
jgi:hypothetical protein